MIYAIVGSRTVNDYCYIEKRLAKYAIDHIVSGGAKGVDTLAERYAEENNIKVEILMPDWGKYGKGAGIIRNKEIIKRADRVIAFWDGESKGTKNVIDTARKMGKGVEVYVYHKEAV